MEQSIKIRIADREYPLKVSSPDKEEIIRKATSELNKKSQRWCSQWRRFRGYC